MPGLRGVCDHLPPTHPPPPPDQVPTTQSDQAPTPLRPDTHPPLRPAVRILLECILVLISSTGLGVLDMLSEMKQVCFPHYTGEFITGGEAAVGSATRATEAV